MVQIKQLRPSEWSEHRKRAMRELGHSIQDLEKNFVEETNKMEKTEIQTIGAELIAFLSTKEMTAREKRTALNMAYMELRDEAIAEKAKAKADGAAEKEKEKEKDQKKEDTEPAEKPKTKKKSTKKKDIKEADKTKAEKEADEVIESAEDEAAPEEKEELFED